MLLYCSIHDLVCHFHRESDCHCLQCMACGVAMQGVPIHLQYKCHVALRLLALAVPVVMLRHWH